MPRDKPIAKKRKFVKDGIFYAELNTFLARELAEDGYAGCEVRVTPTTTEVIIRATRTRNVVGTRMRRIRELTALIQKRFKFEPGGVELYAERVKEKALSGLAQAEAVRYRLFEGLSVRRACYSVLRFVMEHGARGCEVVVSGKLRGQRAKSMKFRDGYLISSGDAINYYIDTAVKHIKMKQGVLGIKVKIMLPYDPNDEKGGAKFKLPDDLQIKKPKEDPVRQEDKLAAGGGGAYGGFDGGAGGGAGGPPPPAGGGGGFGGGDMGGYGGPSGGPGPMGGGGGGGAPPDAGYDDQQGGGMYDPSGAAPEQSFDDGGYGPAQQYTTPQGPPADYYAAGPPPQQYADPSGYVPVAPDAAGGGAYYGGSGAGGFGAPQFDQYGGQYPPQ